MNATHSRLSFRYDKRRPITCILIHARFNLLLRSGTITTPIERSEAVGLVRIVEPTTVAMPNVANNNTSGHDHILRGQVNWVSWLLQFRLDAHVEGIWFLSDGSGEILDKPDRPTRPARASTDLTTTRDASNTASNALATTTLEVTNTTSIYFSHQIFLYQIELQFCRINLYDYERQQERINCARKMLYARFDHWMSGIIHDDKDDSLASHFARLQEHHKPKPSLTMQLTRRKIDQISLATCRDMSEYLNKMRQLGQKLAYASEPMSNMCYIGRLHDGIPARYNSWGDRYYDTVEDPNASESSLVSLEGRLVHWECKLK